MNRISFEFRDKYSWTKVKSISILIFSLDYWIQVLRINFELGISEKSKLRELLVRYHVIWCYLSWKVQNHKYVGYTIKSLSNFGPNFPTWLFSIALRTIQLTTSFSPTALSNYTYPSKIEWFKILNESFPRIVISNSCLHNMHLLNILSVSKNWNHN